MLSGNMWICEREMNVPSVENEMWWTKSEYINNISLRLGQDDKLFELQNVTRKQTNKNYQYT